MSFSEEFLQINCLNHVTNYKAVSTTVFENTFLLSQHTVLAVPVPALDRRRLFAVVVTVSESFVAPRCRRWIDVSLVPTSNAVLRVDVEPQ